MNGFLLLDKPKGITSFLCIKKLRRIFGVKRMGFAGTLDPLATGLMIVAVGEATKMIPFLEGADKVYEVKIRLGKVSTTYDGEGEIGTYEKRQGRKAKKPTRALIEETLKKEFAGERDQIPPSFSAVWVDGKRAYDLARKKKDFKLKSRRVSFYDLKIKAYTWPLLSIKVHCSSGTYIRSLAYDLGVALKCGGYVAELRRVKIGEYSIKDAVKLDDLNALNAGRFLVRPEEMFKNLPRLELTREQYDVLKNGGLVENKPGYVQGPVLAMFEGVCTGILELHNEQLKYWRKFLVERFL